MAGTLQIENLPLFARGAENLQGTTTTTKNSHNKQLTVNLAIWQGAVQLHTGIDT